MKKQFSICIPFFFAFLPAIILTTAGHAQKIQLSTVREQNSNKRPVPNAQVIFSDALPAASDQSGNLRLVFQDKKAGDLIFFTEIKKAGYELVNSKDLEILKISNTERLGEDIILAKTGVVDAAKKEYYGISDKALLAGFEKEKRALRDKLQKKELEQQDYLNQVTALQEQYDRQKQNLDALAEKFARVNFDDVTPVYQEALELFKAGKISEAIARLESINPAKRTEEIIKEEKRIVGAQAELDAQRAALTKEKRQQIANLRLLADMYNVQFDPVKAESQYDQLLRLDSTDLEILQDAADFYRENYRYDKALQVLPLIMIHPQAEDWQRASSHVDMGDVYSAIGQLKPAMQAYLSYKNAYAEMLKKEPKSQLFISNTAVSYIKLGKMYTLLGDLDTALTFFANGAWLFKELHFDDPQNIHIEEALAKSYGKIGETYTALHDLNAALIFFKECNKMAKELSEAHPLNIGFKNILAISYSDLGQAHIELNHLDTALILFIELNKLAIELCEDHPLHTDFKNILSISYSKLGDTYTSLGKLDSAFIFYEKDLELTKELYIKFPQNVDFKNYLAISYAKLGEFCRNNRNDNSKARNYFKQAQTLWSELVRDAPMYSEFIRFLHKVQKDLEELDKVEDSVTLINNLIQNEPDTLAQYQLYTILGDTLRLRIKTDPEQKTSLANALNNRAWLGFFLAWRSVGATLSHPDTWAAIEADVREGMAIDPDNNYLPTNLAPALLLQGKKDAALAEYKKWMDKPFGEPNYPTYREAFLDDLNTFEKRASSPQRGRQMWRRRGSFSRVNDSDFHYPPKWLNPKSDLSL